MMLSAENRRKCISIARRLVQPGRGSSRQLLRERGTEYGTIDVRRYLGSVPFTVVGGLATRLYMPERMTLDADVLVLPDKLVEAEHALEGSECKKLGQLSIGGSTWRLPEGQNLDLIALNEPWVADAISHAVAGPGGLPYAVLPYLVLMKLTSGRMQDLADISRMLGGADEKMLERTRQLIGRYRSGDLEDLGSLISLGKLEYKEGGTSHNALGGSGGKSGTQP